MFSWLSNTDRNWEGEIWKKHSVHINYDFQLCKAERRDKRWVGFFSHMCSRFPGRRTMTHRLQPLNLCLDSNQRSHPPERDCESSFALSPSQPPTWTTTTAWTYQWTQTTWHALFLPFGLFKKVLWIPYDGIYLHNFTCCEAFRESATFLTQQVNWSGMFFHPAPLTMETPRAAV